MRTPSNRATPGGSGVWRCLVTLIAGALALHGCAIIDIRQPLQIATNPQHYNQVLGPDETIEVRFESGVDRQSAERLTSIRDLSSDMEIGLRWERNTMLVEPRAALVSGRRYVLRLDGTLRGVEDKEWTIDTIIPFFYRTMLPQSPTATAIAPPSGATIATDSTLSIVFDRPIDPNTLRRGLSIEPGRLHHIDWDERHQRLTIRPRSTWDHHSLIRIGLDDTVSGANGVPLTQPISIAYWVEESPDPLRVMAIEVIDGTLPEAEMATVSGSDASDPDRMLHPNDALRMLFSTAPDIASVEGALTIQPHITTEYLWVAPDILVIRPPSGWQIDRHYWLTLERSASDRLANQLTSAIALPLRTSSSHLMVERIRIAEDDGGEIVTTSAENAIVLRAPNPLSRDYTFVFEFTDDFLSAENRLIAQQSITIGPLLPNGLRAPRRRSFGWIGARVLSITFYDVHPSTADTTNLLMLTINGGPDGIRASNGAYLRNDLRQLLRIEE